MQNKKSVGVTNSTDTPNVSRNSTFIQIQPNNIQQQKFIPINMNNLQKQQQTGGTTSYIAVQGASNTTQYIPIQCNNGTQLVRLQLPNSQVAQGYIKLPSNQINTSNLNTNIIPIQPQIRTQSPSQQITYRNISPAPIHNKSQVLLSNNKLVFKQPGDIHNVMHQPKSSFLKVNAAGSSLVGTVSSAQSTPVVRIDTNSSPRQYVQQSPQPQQKIYIFNSPVKNNQFVAVQPGSSINNTSSSSATRLVHSIPAGSTIAVNNSTMQHLSSENMSSFLAAIQPKQPNMSNAGVSGQMNSTMQPTVYQATISPQKVQPSNNKQTTMSGTLLLLNSFPKQQIIVPKSNQTNQVFVPITLGGNVSLNHPNLLQSTAHNNKIVNRTIQIDHSKQKSTCYTSPGTSSYVIANQNKYVSQQETANNSRSFLFQTIQNNADKSKQHNSSKHKQQNIEENVPPSSPRIAPKTKSTASSSTVSKPTKKPCNCTKSQCLKLYCECFANGEFCSNCNCRMCLNNITNETERSKAIKACLERNPHAFHPKIGKGKIKGDTERRHTKGCNCKRSGCLKNYCECYEAKILCSSLCKCSGCKNFEESADRKTLMHLADAAEERVLQQNAAKTKLESQMTIVESKPNLEAKERLPSAFITTNVIKATCDILLASVQEAELADLSTVEAERLLFEEFSTCLNQIIDKSKQQRQFRGKR